MPYPFKVFLTLSDIIETYNKYIHTTFYQAHTMQLLLANVYNTFLYWVKFLRNMS